MLEQLQIFWDFLIAYIIPRFAEFMASPLHNHEMFWLILPLLCALTMMTLYFGKHKTEELGWNTAFGNTVSLFFVFAGLVRYLLATYPMEEILLGGPLTYKFGLLGVLALQTLILIYFNYTHRLPQRLAFVISSSLPVNVTSFLSIILVMGDLPFDYITLGAAFFTFIVFWVIFTILQAIVAPSEEAKATLAKLKAQREEHRKEKLNQMKSTFYNIKDTMLHSLRGPPKAPQNKQKS